MFNVPLGEGAEVFIWIVCILMAFVNALLFTNSLATKDRQKKEKEVSSHEDLHSGEKRKVIL